MCYGEISGIWLYPEVLTGGKWDGDPMCSKMWLEKNFGLQPLNFLEFLFLLSKSMSNLF